MESYYVDTSIYLNLWQKEENPITKEPYWKFAKKFFEKVEENNSIIYYSGYLLKELYFILDRRLFDKKLLMFETSSNFVRIGLSKEEYDEARKIEIEVNYEVSFYDIIHMLLSRKTNSILITRDKKLIEVCKRHNIIAKMPEEIL